MVSQHYHNCGYLMRDAALFPGFRRSKWDPGYMMTKKNERRRFDYNKYCEETACYFVDFLNNHVCGNHDPEGLIESVEMIKVCHTCDYAIRPDRIYMAVICDIAQLETQNAADSAAFKVYFEETYNSPQNYLSFMPMYPDILTNPEVTLKKKTFRWDLLLDYHFHRTLNQSELQEYMQTKAEQTFEKYYAVGEPVRD